MKKLLFLVCAQLFVFAIMAQIVGNKSNSKANNNLEFLPSSTITYYAPGKNATTHEAATNIVIGKASMPPFIDGIDDEQVWAEATLFEGQTIGVGNGDAYVFSNDDAQLSWKAAWDETALYFVIYVKDDVLVWNDDNNIWHIDAVELYVTKNSIAQTETNLSRNLQTKVLYQNLYLASPLGRSIMEFRGNDISSPAGSLIPVDGTSVARTYNETTKTTIFEIRYEWAKMIIGENAFTSVAENDKIRIGMMMSDNDDPTNNGRDHKVYFVEKIEPSAGQSFKDWAVVTLKNTPTGFSKPKNRTEVLVFPNPAAATVSFSRASNVDFYNLSGQKVLSVQNASSADVSGLIPGVYNVVVDNEAVGKLLVNKQNK